MGMKGWASGWKCRPAAVNCGFGGAGAGPRRVRLGVYVGSAGRVGFSRGEERRSWEEG